MLAPIMVTPFGYHVVTLERWHDVHAAGLPALAPLLAASARYHAMRALLCLFTTTV